MPQRSCPYQSHPDVWAYKVSNDSKGFMQIECETCLEPLLRNGIYSDETVWRRLLQSFVPLARLVEVYGLRSPSPSPPPIRHGSRLSSRAASSTTSSARESSSDSGYAAESTISSDNMESMLSGDSLESKSGIEGDDFQRPDWMIHPERRRFTGVPGSREERSHELPRQHKRRRDIMEVDSASDEESSTEPQASGGHGEGDQWFHGQYGNKRSRTG
ncbi:uncharacterized protein HMPREF1541_06642 [Cyphellophora europaea CBS 101466]|uniref:Uncharacterized protein n=1 Tax=Cyphellophora europaea (strain CBS 101466) TaxID=1220924 RepID=W2RQK7_CYPE1|nr:uncharacterized protein HMPREF1541_06642 [Cyphellophora europaea CBS 101466]ETN38605.1 hypothetical protein HMPREF1541_06642 [Cyphellophora europaea CBS 101466]